MWGEEDILGREGGDEQREGWWIEHEKIMRNEILLNKMSSLRQWSGEHRCHFAEIVTIDEFHLQRHQFLRCSIFLDFAAIEAGFENLALKADRVSAPMRQLWHWDEGWIGKGAHMYLWMKTARYEDFLLAQIFGVKRGGGGSGFAVWRRWCIRRNWST